jgi:AcrR family transcriptional regulator
MERGFDRTSLRAVARAAHVDSALVHHYFDSKAELFLDALRPVPPDDDLLVYISSGPADVMGERLTRVFLGLWSDPVRGPRLRTVLISAAGNSEVATAMRGVLVGEVLERVARAVDVDDAPLRVAACASQLLGLAMSRYVLGIEPLAHASEDQVVALVAPTLQRYLTGDISEIPRATD